MEDGEGIDHWQKLRCNSAIDVGQQTIDVIKETCNIQGEWWMMMALGLLLIIRLVWCLWGVRRVSTIDRSYDVIVQLTSDNNPLMLSRKRSIQGEWWMMMALGLLLIIRLVWCLWGVRRVSTIDRSYDVTVQLTSDNNPLMLSSKHVVFKESDGGAWTASLLLIIRLVWGLWRMGRVSTIDRSYDVTVQFDIGQEFIEVIKETCNIQGGW